jgi:hypothetical protein
MIRVRIRVRQIGSSVGVIPDDAARQSGGYLSAFAMDPGSRPLLSGLNM